VFRLLFAQNKVRRKEGACWKDRKLQTTLFDPFELVRRSNRTNGNEINRLPLQNSDFQNWLPSWTRTQNILRASGSKIQDASTTGVPPSPKWRSQAFQVYSIAHFQQITNKLLRLSR
jgi:hypothetical protein